MTPEKPSPGFTLDIDSLIGETGLNREDYLEIYELFQVTYEGLMKDLEEALARGDTEAAVRAAHTLKGAAANLGFAPMAEAARKIQEGPGDTAGAARAVMEIRTLYASLDAQVQAYAAR